MKTLEKMVASVAVAGLLLGGAGPALADGDRHRSNNDNNIKVTLVEKHAKSGKKKTIEEKRVNLKEAARYADRKCDRGDYWHFYKKAKWVEEENKEWVKVCSYDHRHNKHKDYYVYFTDVDKKHHHDWDDNKDKGKDKGNGKGKGR